VQATSRTLGVERILPSCRDSLNIPGAFAKFHHRNFECLLLCFGYAQGKKTSLVL
jgi:hypothetical protein